MALLRLILLSEPLEYLSIIAFYVRKCVQESQQMHQFPHIGRQERIELMFHRHEQQPRLFVKEIKQLLLIIPSFFSGRIRPVGTLCLVLGVSIRQQVELLVFAVALSSFDELHTETVEAFHLIIKARQVQPS